MPRSFGGYIHHRVPEGPLLSPEIDHETPIPPMLPLSVPLPSDSRKVRDPSAVSSEQLPKVENRSIAMATDPSGVLSTIPWSMHRNSRERGEFPKGRKSPPAIGVSWFST